MEKEESMAEELRKYAEEIGLLPEYFRLNHLIASHRHLREKHIKAREDRRKAIDEVVEQVKQAEMDLTWIKVDKLRGITIQELADLIGGEA